MTNFIVAILWLLILIEVIHIAFTWYFEIRPKDIKVRYYSSSSPKLEKTEKGDWIDLPSAHHYKYKKGDIVEVKFGLAMELPADYEAHILPRSSTYKNYGLILTNSMGIIDNTYCGDDDEWQAHFLAIRDGVIKRGERVAQFRIVENQPDLKLKEVPSLENASRGGYGSTGK